MDNDITVTFLFSKGYRKLLNSVDFKIAAASSYFNLAFILRVGQVCYI